MAEKNNEDEDLMSDFRDLFDDNEDGQQTDGDSTAQPAREIDELDAFLDDFSDDLDRMNGEEGSAQEMAPPAEKSVDDGDTELDIAPSIIADDELSDLEAPEPVAEDGEDAFADDGALDAEDEPQEIEDSDLQGKDVVDDELGPMADEDPLADQDSWVQEQADDEDLLGEADLNDELDLAVDELSEAEEPAPSASRATEAGGADAAKVAAAAAGLGAATAAANGATSQPQAAVPIGTTPSAVAASGRMALLAVVLAVIGGVVAALALFLSLSGTDEAPVAAAPSAQGQTAALERMQTDIAALAGRINELAIIIEGPMSHLRQSSEEALVEIDQRLGRLEGALSELSSAPPQQVAVQQPAAAPRSAPAQSGTGDWVINLVSLSNEQDARTELERLRQLGIRAEVQRAQHEGRTWYRLRVTGFDSRDGATAYVDTIADKAGLQNPWVTRAD